MNDDSIIPWREIVNPSLEERKRRAAERYRDREAEVEADQARYERSRPYR